MPPPGGHIGRGYLTEEEKANRPKVTLPLLKRIFSYLLPYWKQMVLVLFCIVLSSVLGLLPSVLTGRIIDEGLIGRNLRMLVTRSQQQLMIHTVYSQITFLHLGLLTTRLLLMITLRSGLRCQRSR